MGVGVMEQGGVHPVAEEVQHRLASNDSSANTIAAD